MQEHTLSLEEKVDAIYKIMKRQEKRALYGSILKWVYRIFLLGYIIYVFTVFVPQLTSSLPMFNMGGVNSENSSSLLDNEQVQNMIEQYMNRYNLEY